MSVKWLNVPTPQNVEADLKYGKHIWQPGDVQMLNLGACMPPFLLS